MSSLLNRWRDTGQRFEFRRHSIFYKRHGSGDTALLLIHGFPSASWDWAPLWQDLCAKFDHVLAPDLLGFGFSDKPPRHRYSLVEQADLCEALLAQFDIGTVHLLAHDYGASIAQELLARDIERPRNHVPRIASAVLLNGGLFPETHRATGTQRLLLSPLGGIASRLIRERRFGRAFAKVFGPQTQPTPIELHDYWQLISHNRGTRAMPRLIRYIDERRRNRERWVGALVNTRVPLRLINGPEDPVSGAHMAQRYSELVAGADVVSLPHIGHYPHVEAPDRTLKAFLDFHRQRVETS